jgi:hypothetical protein
MVRIAALALALLVSVPASARPHHRRVIRLPAARIVCDATCRANVELYRTMDAIAKGQLEICGYQDDRAIWVRPTREPGECRRVAIPRDRLTGWR